MMEAGVPGMDICFSFVGNRDPYVEGPDELGPVMSLLQERSYTRVYLFCTGHEYFERAKTVEQLAREGDIDTQFKFINLDLESVIDYEEIYGKMKESIDTVLSHIGDQPVRLSILLDPGTPQMQTCWFLLAKSGYVEASLLQGIPARFAGGAYKVREVRLDSGSILPAVTLKSEEKPLSEKVWFTARNAPKIVGDSARFRDALERARQAAKYDISVLILGETGSGKEVIARIIHDLSDRRDQPFLPINCASITATLAESELFGCRKGAFTGADRDRLGQFRAAEGGTVMLDEIGDLPMEIQPKLLRVLESGLVLPVGHDIEVQVNVRILAATNRKLEELVEEGTFRRDLYERLNQMTILIPSLSERKEDIPLLVREFTGQWNRAYHEEKGLSEDTISYFMRYPWPGNVRGLQNAVTSMCAVGRSSNIGPELMPPELLEYFHGSHQEGDFTISIPDDGMNLKALLSQIEKRYYEEALERAEGNREQAAGLLGLNGAAFRKALRERFNIS